jgi:putative RecB family exonuclease
LSATSALEDPREIRTEGVELKVRAELDGAPVLGIIDRLDRESDGTLSIVDYKTGALPNRDYDAKTFANAEVYAALCEEHLGERPQQLRLLYVAHGQAITRTVTPVAVKARRRSAAQAWSAIVAHHERAPLPPRRHGRPVASAPTRTSVATVASRLWRSPAPVV